MNGTMRLSVVIDGQTREATVAVNQVTDAMRRLEGQAQQTGPQAAQALRTTGQAAADAANLSNQQLLGMQFQLQDIVVGLTSGQSPFTVMMQQGSQMVQAFAAGTGPVGALRSVGQGIAEFLSNPLNLALLGFSAATGVIAGFFSSISQGAEDANVLLEEHKKQIDAVRDAYSGARKSAEDYAKALGPMMLLGLQNTRNDLRYQAEDQRGGIASSLQQSIRARTSWDEQVFLENEGGLAAFKRMAEVIASAAPGLESGAVSASSLMEEINRIATSAPDSAAELRRFAAELGNQLAPLADLETRLKENASAIKLVTDTATSQDRATVGLRDAATGATKAIDWLSQSMRGISRSGSYFDDIPSDVKARDTSGMSLLNLIAKAEGTDLGRGYNETLGYGKFTGGPVDLVSMTLNEVLELQKQMLAHPDNEYNSSAVGRYQIVGQTLKGVMQELGLTGDMIFTPALQDRMALHLANQAGRSVPGLTNIWQGFERGIAPGDILSAFDASFRERSAVADEEKRLELSKDALAYKKQDAEISAKIAASVRQQNKDAAEFQRNSMTMLREQNAFVDQFRSLTEGLVSGIARARQAGDSWTEALGAGLDMVTNKALSLLEKFADKALDMALWGKPGGGGGGLLGGLLTSFFGGMGNPMQNALGNAFTDPIMTFDKGGVGNWPTLFPMRGGMGQAFEAGPEAIMPLARGPSGHLGVRAQGGGAAVFNMNVVNQAGADVSSRATPNGSGGLDIEMLIERKIDQQLARPETVRNLSQSLGTRPPVRQWGEY